MEFWTNPYNSQPKSPVSWSPMPNAQLLKLHSDLRVGDGFEERK